jgi:hypothetical protein
MEFKDVKDINKNVSFVLTSLKVVPVFWVIFTEFSWEEGFSW